MGSALDIGELLSDITFPTVGSGPVSVPEALSGRAAKKDLFSVQKRKSWDIDLEEVNLWAHADGHKG